MLGFAAGGAAYGPALTDLVILAPEGRIFVTGPDVVRSSPVRMSTCCGSADLTLTGADQVVHVVADDESHAIRAGAGAGDPAG